jgi:hypothetical protein
VTKRKETGEGTYSRLELAQYRLRRIAKDLEDGAALAPGELKFLVEALRRSGSGEDANSALGVKGKRGERKTPEQKAKREKLHFVMSLVTALTTAEVTEYFTRPAMSLEDAFAAAAKAFSMDEETVRIYWYRNPKLRSAAFDRPISSLPD